MSTDKAKIHDSGAKPNHTGIPNERRVTHTWLSGNLSATLIIPIEIARRHGLDKPANVIVEESGDGILIRKVRLS